LLAINVSKFVSVPCNTELDVHNVLVKAFETQCPSILLSYVHECFKKRPSKTNFIYYTGVPQYVTRLLELGWQQMSTREYEEMMFDKPKRVPTNGARTDKEIALANNKNV